MSAPDVTVATECAHVILAKGAPTPYQLRELAAAFLGLREALKRLREEHDA